MKCLICASTYNPYIVRHLTTTLPTLCKPLQNNGVWNTNLVTYCTRSWQTVKTLFENKRTRMSRTNAVGNSDGAQIINQCFERSFSPSVLKKHSEICMLIELRQSRHWQMKWHFIAHTGLSNSAPWQTWQASPKSYISTYTNHSHGIAWFINISLPWRWKNRQKTKIKHRENHHGERMHSGEEPASKTALSVLSDQSTNEIQFRKKKAPRLHSVASA